MYKYYLLPDAKKDLDRASILERSNALDTIEKLINGLWGGGTRVKKLHGVSKTKCIYEAREDSGRRLLFSIGSRQYEEKTPIYIHNVCIEHDKVIRMAQRVLGNDFSEEHYNNEVETDNITAEELINEEKKYQEQNYITAMIDDIGCYEITEDDVYRFIEQKNVTEEETITFRLKLSNEQKEVLNQPLPKIISGTAGSGKTTILLYNLMIEPDKKKLYITSNGELCNESKQLFSRLVKGSEYEKSFLDNTDFKTFEEILYRELGMTLNKTMTRDKFIYEYKKFYRGLKNSKKFEPLKVWEEIRSVWKANLNEKSMSREDYISLEEKVAPNFYEDRETAYKIYNWYQKLLDENVYYDELDLIKEYLIKSNIKKKYDYIICDEVQDLTMMHIDMLFSLTDKPYNTILAGDDHQIINHSGFTWDKAKQYYYNNYSLKVKLQILQKNYRCVGNVANLAREINKFQEQFVESKYKTQESKFKPYGNKPELITLVPENEMINELKDLGPLRAILVNEKYEKDRLKNIFMSKFNYSPLIFSVEESKGLEFDSVVLWKLIGGDKESLNTWKKVFRINDYNKNKELKDFIKYKTSCIYVAITRAMRGCVIYEDDDTLWSHNKINSHIKNAVILNKGLLGMDEDITDEDWLYQGKQLINRKFYNEAIECFERISTSSLFNEVDALIKKCNAMKLVENHEYKKAAELFREANDEYNMEKYYDLAGCYEELHNYFMINWRRRKYPLKGLEYGIKMFDTIGDWEKSARYCTQAKLYNESIVRFEKCGMTKEILDIYLNKINNPIEALKYNSINGNLNNEGLMLVLYEKIYAKNYNNIERWKNNEGKYIIHNGNYAIGIIQSVKDKMITIKLGDKVIFNTLKNSINNQFNFNTTRNEKITSIKLIAQRLSEDNYKKRELEKEILVKLFEIVKDKIEFKNVIEQRIENFKGMDDCLEYLESEGQVVKGIALQSLNFYNENSDKGIEIIEDQLWILDNNEIVVLNYYFNSSYIGDLSLEENYQLTEEQDLSNFDFKEAIKTLLLKVNDKEIYTNKDVISLLNRIKYS